MTHSFKWKDGVKYDIHQFLEKNILNINILLFGNLQVDSCRREFWVHKQIQRRKNENEALPNLGDITVNLCPVE